MKQCVTNLAGNIKSVAKMQATLGFQRLSASLQATTSFDDITNDVNNRGEYPTVTAETWKYLQANITRCRSK